jgi:predicted ATP-grasp superfamily ATP-dependent carboligase
LSNSEVVIVGAGPYGLSLAAHLRHRGIGFRIFGVPMQNWRRAMPAGMFLKSDGAGTNLSDPADTMTLAQYCSSRSLSYGDHGVPIALQTFVDYALSFQQQLVPEVEECGVVALAGKPGRFELELDTGERVTARRVVLAVGTSYFSHVPHQLATLPSELVTHSRDHSNLAKFAQRDVVVVGGGQSALETAALLKEQGARVQVLVRAPSVLWNPAPSVPAGLRLSGPQSALGRGWKSWFYCNGQGVFQHFPLQFRSMIVGRALGPAGAWWLKDRVLGRFPVLCGCEVREAREKGGRVCLSIVCADGRTNEISADHVIAATGYKVNVDSLSFLDAELAQRLRREGTAPALSPDFESSVAGLHFTGLAAATRFGPSMRFVFGAEYAARRIASALTKDDLARANSPNSHGREYRSTEKPRLQRRALPARKRRAAANFDTSVPALVLNFGEYPLHQSSLGIIRSLGSVGTPVFAVQRNPFIPSGVSRYISGKFLWKADGKNTDQFLEGMETIAKILDRPTILVPADDLSAILIAEHADVLASWFRFARPPAALPRAVANKRNLYDLCQHLGIACPHTVFPNSRKEWLDFAKSARLPVVVKVIEPWLAPRGLKTTAIVSERQELMDYCDRHGWQVPPTALMIQEMIPSSASEDWFVHGYCDARSNPVAIFTGVKLRSYPAFAGPTTLARSVKNDGLQRQTIELLTAISYCGIMDLDYRLDHRDGRYNLLDFNPRVGAQFRLFKDADGTDVVRALHLDLTDRTPRVGPQIEGRTFVAEIQDLFASGAYWRSGALTVKDWWRSLRGIDETAWYASNDPVPFVLMCIHIFSRAVLRSLGLSIRLMRQKAANAIPIRLPVNGPSGNGREHFRGLPQSNRAMDLENQNR